jgi:ribosomal protein S18 acetylase RimI-like enzyme
MSDQFRWLIRRNLPQVLAMDVGVCGDDAWTETQWIRFLRQKNIIGMVAVRGDEEVSGVCLFELHKTYLLVLKFFVGPEYRGQGVGSMMLRRMQDKVDYAGRQSLVFADISLETNLDLLVWLKGKGFTAVYFDCHDDLIHMEWQRSNRLSRA